MEEGGTFCQYEVKIQLLATIFVTNCSYYIHLVSLDIVHQSNSNNVFFFGHDDGSTDSIHSLKTFKPIDGNHTCKYVGGASVGTVQEFQELSQEYFKVNEHTRFPPKYYLEEGTTKLFGDLLEELHGSLDNRILTGHNAIFHLEVLGYSEKDLNDHNINKHSTCDNVVTFLVPESFLIVVCVVVDGNDTEMIKAEMKKCNGILKAIHISNQKHLASQYISVMGTLVLPSIARHQLQEFGFLLNKLDHGCGEILFVTKVEMDSLGNLKKIWWNNISKAIGNINVPMSVDKETRIQAVSNVAAEMMVTMSIITTYLPKATHNTKDKIATLLLNNEQIDVIQDDASWKVISSDYGCGKSICLKEIARQLSNKNDGSNIYYICHDPFTLMEIEVEEFFRKVLGREKVKSLSLKKITDDAGFNVADIYSVSGSPSKNICLLLEHLQNKNRKCHFLIDEMHLHNLDISYCQELRDSLKTYFNDSTIVIALQSMKTKHTLFIKNEEQVFEQGSLETAGFKTFHLKRSMRMASNLFKLANIACNVIERHETEIPLEVEPTLKGKIKSLFKRSSRRDNLKNSHSRSLISSTETTITTSSTKTTSPPTTTSSATTTSPPPTKTTTAAGSLLKRDVNDRQKYVDVSKIDDPSMTAKRFPDVLPPDVDHKVVKKVSLKTEFIKGKSGTKIASIYKPQLIYLDDNFSFDSEVSGKVLATVLKKRCFENHHRTTFICGNLNEVALVNFALQILGCDSIEYVPYLKGMFPSREEKVQIIDKLHNDINRPLVTDYRGFRGCECDHCILFIDPNQTYANHILVEVMTRATAKLDFFVYPFPNAIKSMWLEVFRKWDESLISKIQVRTERKSEEEYNIIIDDEVIDVVEVEDKDRDMLLDIRQSINNETQDLSKNSFRYVTLVYVI